MQVHVSTHGEVDKIISSHRIFTEVAFIVSAKLGWHNEILLIILSDSKNAHNFVVCHHFL